MHSEIPGIASTLTAEMHVVLPRTAEVLDASRKDFGDHPALGYTALGVGAVAAGVYSFGNVVEGGLVATGTYFGHKYGWEVGGAAQGLLSGAVEVGMGVMTYIGMRKLPHTIAAYARIKNEGKDPSAIPQRRPIKTALRNAAVGWQTGTPGIMFDAMLRWPERSPERHARRGAVATAALIAVNAG